jgi:hypothetical protein
MFKTAVDHGAKGVVCSNPLTYALDSAKRKELESIDEMRNRGGTDSEIDIRWTVVFRLEKRGI